MSTHDVDALRVRMAEWMRSRGVYTLSRAAEATAWATPAEVETDERPYFTGYPGGRLYGWDQYFDAILQLYAGWEPDTIRNSLCLFLERTERDGFIPRTLPRVWWGAFHQQPFLAQQALLLLKAGDPLDWFFPEYYFRLKHYLVHWLRIRDVRGAGLSVWDHAGHTGMDNQYERAGYFHDAFCEGVDLNSYLVRECEALALLSAHGAALGAVPDEGEQARAWARGRADALQRYGWSDADGIFFDYHAREERSIRVKHVGCFAPLWAGVATAEQARRLVDTHLSEHGAFASPYPVPALAADEPGYIEGYRKGETLDCCSWRAHSWMPTNYIVFQGLRRYGFTDAAAALAQSCAGMFCAHPFREYYGAETGKGWGRKEFIGWSSLALFMEAELAGGSDPTALNTDPIARP